MGEEQGFAPGGDWKIPDEAMEIADLVGLVFHCPNCHGLIQVIPLIRSVETVEVTQVSTVGGEAHYISEQMKVIFDDTEINHRCPVRELRT